MELEQALLGATFANPVLLAAGTCGFGRELAGVVELDALGGFVTKAVTREPREGDPAPRVSEFDAGMINSVGLANPGVDAVRDEKLPWIREHVRRAKVLVNVAGHTVGEFVEVIDVLDGEEGFLGYELNVSCPNDRRVDGLPFGLDTEALGRVVSAARETTDRPLVVKLPPNVPDMAATARAAAAAGADGLTLVNTMPGLVLDPETGRPRLGAGSGGVSGPALRPVGVHAVWRAREAVEIPLVGVGGIRTADDALQYILAGASLVQVGTASFADPRTAHRVVNGLAEHGRRRGVARVADLVGAAHRNP